MVVQNGRMKFGLLSNHRFDAPPAMNIRFDEYPCGTISETHATDVIRHACPRHQTDKPPETTRVCFPGKAGLKEDIRAGQDVGSPAARQGGDRPSIHL
jgi:hypothetical protein